MSSIARSRYQVKPPIMLILATALLKFIFPGWHIQAQPRPRVARRQFQPRTLEAALSLSLQFGYNSVRWEAVNG